MIPHGLRRRALVRPMTFTPGESMPFIRGDADLYDEMFDELGPDVVGGERPTGEFVYQEAQAKFDPKKLGKGSRLMLEALRGAGATAFRVRYDGGFDEGFSHRDAICFGARSASVDEALAKLSDATLVAGLRESMKEVPWSAGRAESYAGPEILREALDELAHEVASTLLGDGFGTGEYQLYGALTADLKTCAITDDERAARPADME
jgi:hypothetical protein